jgi:ATP-dependent DNA helicase RecG
LSERQLSEHQQKTLKMVQASPTITAKAMSVTLSVSPRTIERDISSLKKMGVLCRKGKDNDGVWVILNRKKE